MNRIEPLGSKRFMRAASRGDFGDFLLIAPFLLLLILLQNAPTPRTLSDLIKGAGTLFAGLS